jgi:hypothetical protein
MNDQDGATDLGAGTIGGRRLPSYRGPQGVLGVVRVLPDATADALQLARRSLIEFDEDDLEQLDARRFVDKDGVEWEIPHGGTLHDNDAQAFVVRDSSWPVSWARASRSLTTPTGTFCPTVATGPRSR